MFDKINLHKFTKWIIGGNLAGPAGMLIGVPAASAAYELLKEATEKREQKLTVSAVE